MAKMAGMKTWANWLEIVDSALLAIKIGIFIVVVLF
jgi:hypothetical protein